MAKSITASVGRMGGINLPNDVKTIQELLNSMSTHKGGPVVPLKVDGLCGNKTIEAIQKFQLFHFGWNGADGKVNPNGETIKKLNEIDEKDKVPEKKKVLSSNFKIRKLFAKNPNPIIGLGNYNFDFYYEMVDLKNNLTCIYSTEKDKLRISFEVVLQFHELDWSPYTQFRTPFAVSFSSFLGLHILNITSNSPREIEHHIFSEMDNKLVGFNLLMAGHSVEGPVGYSTSQGWAEWYFLK